MNEFKNRDRFASLKEAEEVQDTFVGWISHILFNRDGTHSYSIMRHINCEHCDYCSETHLGIRIHDAKSDAYEFQKINIPENYGLPSEGRLVDYIWKKFEAFLAQTNTLSFNERKAFLLRADSELRSRYKNQKWENEI